MTEQIIIFAFQKFGTDGLMRKNLRKYGQHTVHSNFLGFFKIPFKINKNFTVILQIIFCILQCEGPRVKTNLRRIQP